MDTPISAADLFQLANRFAIVGWLVLIVSAIVRWRLGRDVIAGVVFPATLSIVYVAILPVHWSSSRGGFASLAVVTTLFTSPWMVLAGWVHFLAFDLFVGAWIARDAADRGLSVWLVIPLLPITLMFGPAGFLLWICIRSATTAAGFGDGNGPTGLTGTAS